MQRPHQSQLQDLTDILDPSEIRTESGNDPQIFLKRDSLNLDHHTEIRIVPHDKTESSNFPTNTFKDLTDLDEARTGSSLKTANEIDHANSGEGLDKINLKNGELLMQEEIENSAVQPADDFESSNNHIELHGQASVIATAVEARQKEEPKKIKHLFSPIAKASKSGLRIPKVSKLSTDVLDHSDDTVKSKRKIPASDQMDTESESSKNDVPKKPTKFKAIKPTKKGANQLDKKKEARNKQMAKTYTSLVENLSYLEKFDWLDADQYNTKLLPMKSLTSNSYWFLICSQYFPRAPFLKHGPYELYNLKLDQLKSFPNEFPTRIPKIFNPEDIMGSEELTLEEQKDLETLNNLLIQEVRDNQHRVPVSKYHSKRKLEPEYIAKYKSTDDEWILKSRQTALDFAESKLNRDLSDHVNIVKKVDLNDLIVLEEAQLYDLSVENEKRFARVRENLISINETEEWLTQCCLSSEDPLVDLKFQIPEEENFLSYLERKQIESKDFSARLAERSAQTNGSKTKPRVTSEDLVCLVCNERDSGDNDLIVFCSRCNMPVHQQCYGIVDIPKDDWICELCINFGPEGKCLRCPLCTRRGGAMKPTVLWADTQYFANLNPDYHEFLSNYAKEERVRNAKLANSLKSKRAELKRSLSNKIYVDGDVLPCHGQGKLIGDDVKHEQNGVSSRHGKGLKFDKRAMAHHFSENEANRTEQSGAVLDLYYDAQNLPDYYTEEELKNEPRPEKVWAHITCCLFIPGLYFGDKEYVTDIDGFNFLAKERFKYECGVCGKKNGAVINCEKGQCKRAFHPECARRAKLCLEIKDTEQPTEHLYTLFCEKHTPLKLRRTFDAKDKKQKEDIFKFCRAAERYYSLYYAATKSKQANPAENALQSDSQEAKVKSENLTKKSSLSINRKLGKYDPGTLYLNLVEEWRKKVPSKLYTVTLAKTRHTVKDEFGSIIKEDIFKVTDVHIPRSNPHKKIGADDQVWTYMPYKNLTPAQKYKKYKKFMMKFKSREKEIHFLKPTKKTSISKKQAPPLDPVLQLYVPDEKLYCICKRKYKGDGTDDLMLACDRCSEWYHFNCVGIPDAGDAFQKASKMRWLCPNCTSHQGKNSIHGNGHHLNTPNKYPLYEEGDRNGKSKKSKNSKKKKSASVAKGEPQKVKKVKK